MSSTFQPGSAAEETSGVQPLLTLAAVSKRFGLTTVLHEISLEVFQGEFLTLLGASGSGKTTLLRLIAGFEQPDAGEIWMAGERLDSLPPYRRRVNTVFQHYALFPHLSVFENVAYGLRVQKTHKLSSSDISARVDEALALVKMIELARRAPAQLSGGQQQRVALARALVNRPRLLLLDEPLSSLDANLRREMQIELKSLQREVGISFLFVTHDQQEAMALSDRIALLRAGELEQVASSREIYGRPGTAYTAEFIGQTNLLRGVVEDGQARCEGFVWPCAGQNGTALFSLRPENIRQVIQEQKGLSTPAGGHDDAGGTERVRFVAKIRRQVFGGSSDLLELVYRDGHTLLARIPSRGELKGEQEFEFSVADAVRVRESSH